MIPIIWPSLTNIFHAKIIGIIALLGMSAIYFVGLGISIYLTWRVFKWICKNPEVLAVLVPGGAGAKAAAGTVAMAISKSSKEEKTADKTRSKNAKS